MAYNHFDYSQRETLFAAPDSSCQIPSSFSIGPTQDYPAVNEVSMGHNYGSYEHTQGSRVFGTDEGEVASRSRLTQEQIAELEREFAIKPKPNTEEKKRMADRMGVDYPRVNVSGSPVHVISYIDMVLELVSKSPS